LDARQGVFEGEDILWFHADELGALEVNVRMRLSALYVCRRIHILSNYSKSSWGGKMYTRIVTAQNELESREEGGVNILLGLDSPLG